MAAHDGFVGGLSTLKFKGTAIGLVHEDGVSWNGSEPTTTKIYSAQRRGAPVVELPDDPGSDELEFDLIELLPDGLIQVFGGTKATSGGATTWSAPSDKIIQKGAVEITTKDGTVITIANASLVANIKGSLKHNEILKVHIKITILSNGALAPFTMKFPDKA